jgi:molybdenum cofactor cytidylyltransferase
MKFGKVPLDDAAGGILAHSVRIEDGTLRKGAVLDADDIARLRTAGLDGVTVARLEAGDLSENEAAARIAARLVSDGMTASSGNTGRANLRAEAAGIVEIDVDGINAMNAVDEAITIATVRPFEAVSAGQVAATVKVITFGVAGAMVDKCLDIAGKTPPLRLAPFQDCRVGLIQTTLPGLKPGLLEKASESTATRLSELGVALDSERHCAHDAAAVADAVRAMAAEGCYITLILGASAIVDRRDIVPSAIESAGGTVEHLGLPVDPGHLMLLAHLGNMRILGIPGSARSPRLHGFDWVLQRLVAGLDVSPDDLVKMGVGGLLKEIHGRPMPREQEEGGTDDDAPRIGALLLAAGQSRRMARVNKLLAEVDGAPMVVHAAKALLASRAAPVVVVLGHQPEKVLEALDGLDVIAVHNPDFGQGLSTSLRAGISALPDEIDGAVVALGDMPGVSPADIDALIDAFDPYNGRAICVPVHDGKRGNPVLWSRRFFGDMGSVSGDVGARHLIGENADQMFEVPRDNPGVLIDLDTPEALARHRDRA